ncbi:MAG TPA: hypothetical protein VNQ76_05945 [Planctomicrobium sp.]|nr:hypothetical protein [Planctomicrobium sp.]
MLLSRRQMMFLLCAAGCQRTPRAGIPRTDILLRISSDGKPLTIGVVDLYNFETGEGGSGTLDEQGEVKISQIALGDYVITIMPPDPEGPEGKLPAGLKEYRVASRFHTPEKSPLKISVSRKTTEFSLEVSGQ